MNIISTSSYCIAENATIADALMAITENKRGCVIVIGGAGALLGILSDGDIRRALVKGAMELTPILKILNPNVLSLNRAVAIAQESKKIFSEHPEINLIPILGVGNVVVDVIARGEKTT
ncbi:MAG: CBS domain-containing protein [Candidatus Paceibacterota bacterium]|jgi:CBS domain-containing protein